MWLHCWRSTPVLWGGVLLWVVLSTACHATRDDAPAQSQDEITVYTALLRHEYKAYLAVFHKAYPDIRVNVVPDATGKLSDRLLNERNNPQADVIWGLAVTNLILFEWYDMLAPYAPDGLARVRSQFRDSHTPPHWVGIDAWTSVFCINTERLEASQLRLPTTWDDLRDPVYQGQLIMPNPLTTGTGYMVIDTILQHYGQTKGWEYLEALHKNIVKYVPASTEPCRLAGAGEIGIGIDHDLAGNLQKTKGKPIEVIFPREGAAWDMEANALVKKVEIKPAAQIFLNWAISDGAMQTYGLKYALTAVKTDLLLPQGLPSDPAHHLFDRDFVWGAAHRDGVLRRWQQRYSNKAVSN